MLLPLDAYYASLALMRQATREPADWETTLADWERKRAAEPVRIRQIAVWLGIVGASVAGLAALALWAT